MRLVRYGCVNPVRPPVHRVQFAGMESTSDWNTKLHSKDKLRKYLEQTRLIDGLSWMKPAGSLGKDEARHEEKPALVLVGPDRQRRKGLDNPD